jgi:hypothetical protein
MIKYRYEGLYFIKLIMKPSLCFQEITVLKLNINTHRMFVLDQKLLWNWIFAIYFVTV